MITIPEDIRTDFGLKHLLNQIMELWEPISKQEEIRQDILAVLESAVRSFSLTDRKMLTVDEEAAIMFCLVMLQRTKITVYDREATIYLIVRAGFPPLAFLDNQGLNNE